MAQNLTPKSGASEQEEIRIIAKGAIGGGAGQEGVRFYVTPNLEVNSRAQYTELSDIRSAAGILIYTGSPSRSFTINGRFVSRTAEEADRTFRYIHLLRGWRTPEKPFATPEVLKLWGYKFNFKGIPVVLESLNESWSEEFDTIKTSAGSDIPIILPVSISLKECQSIEDKGIKEFDYNKFKAGNLDYW